jgi:hypothetical protein
MAVQDRSNSSAKRLIFSSMLLCIVLRMGSGPVLANSEIIQAPFTETDLAGQSYHDLGVCRFITGPRDDLPAGQFLLTVGDQHAIDASEVQLSGTYTTQGRAFSLHPDKTAATEYFQSVLRMQLGDESAFFQLKDLDARVSLAPSEARADAALSCNVSLTGWLTLSNATQRPVSLSFKGEGLYYPGDTARSVTGSTSAPDAGSNSDPSCPTASLAPFGEPPRTGLAPVPEQCTPGTGCLVDFPFPPQKGYRWWTSFQYYPPPSYFYNYGLRTPFAPKNVFLGGDGLHLRISRIDLGGGPVPAGAEAVLMFNSDGSEANLGYGRYLVTAKVLTTSSWATLDPNVAFGAFTYERFGNGSTGSPPNPNRELDLAEISRWGWDQNPQTVCPNTGAAAPLCKGNAQFTLQPWENTDGNTPPTWANLNRYTIGPDVQTITLVMTWPGANQPVTFDQYDGAFTLEGLPPQPSHTFTSVEAQNLFVPATNCERFHLNLWMGFFNNPGAKAVRECQEKNQNCPPNPPPRTVPQEVVVTNFEFKPQ